MWDLNWSYWIENAWIDRSMIALFDWGNNTKDIQGERQEACQGVMSKSVQWAPVVEWWQVRLG